MASGAGRGAPGHLGVKTMNWLISLLIGAGVGVIYGLTGIRSPAPPVIALLGLLGMLGGEHLAHLARQHIFAPAAASETPLSR
jgi:XapX domain-containing protein